MVCETRPGRPRTGARRTAGADRSERAGELRQGRAGADLRGPAQDGARRGRCSTYYFTSQLAAINSATGRDDRDRHAGDLRERDAVAERRATCWSRPIKRPFSHLMPMNGFPQDVEIWDARAASVAQNARRSPSREGTPLTGVEPGPRGYRWRADQPATIVWVEALDGGDSKNDGAVPRQGRLAGGAVHAASRPRSRRPSGASAASRSRTKASRSSPKTIARRGGRAPGSSSPAPQPRKLWDRKQDAAYDNPGTPVARHGSGDSGRRRPRRRRGGAIMQNGDFIYLTGVGASPEGDRPFLDRLNLKTLQTRAAVPLRRRIATRPFVAPLNDDMTRFLTRYETQKERAELLHCATATRRRSTPSRSSRIRSRSSAASSHEFVTYKRKDGVTLSGTLYLPPGYKKGDARAASSCGPTRASSATPTRPSQVTGSPNRFTLVSGDSHMFLLLSGYAILDNPTMPIVGPGETANDTTSSSSSRARRRRSTRSSRWASPIAIASASAATATARS